VIDAAPPIDAAADAAGANATEAGLTAIIAGAIPEAQISTQVYPQIATTATAAIARDCGSTNPLDMPPCSCAEGSTGATYVSLLDANPRDCAVTTDEVAANGLIQAFFAPDITIAGKPALSYGLKVDAVPASYAVVATHSVLW